VLSGLNLKPEIEKRIESEIRKVVMRELATIDLKGDLTVVPRDKFPIATAEPNGGDPMGFAAVAGARD
jgi:hypothetical protein